MQSSSKCQKKEKELVLGYVEGETAPGPAPRKTKGSRGGGRNEKQIRAEDKELAYAEPVFGSRGKRGKGEKKGGKRLPSKVKEEDKRLAYSELEVAPNRPELALPGASNRKSSEVGSVQIEPPDLARQSRPAPQPGAVRVAGINGTGSDSEYEDDWEVDEENQTRESEQIGTIQSEPIAAVLADDFDERLALTEAELETLRQENEEIKKEMQERKRTSPPVDAERMKPEAWWKRNQCKVLCMAVFLTVIIVISVTAVSTQVRSNPTLPPTLSPSHWPSESPSFPLPTNTPSSSPTSDIILLFQRTYSMKSDDIVELPRQGLEGSIATQIGLLTNLISLILYDNNITGTIPTEVGMLEALKILDLYQNKLEGTIPSEIGHLEDLEKLELYYNDLSGTIPSEIGKWRHKSKYQASENCSGD